MSDSEELAKQAEKKAEIGVRVVRSEILEQVRGIILQLREKGLKNSEIGNLAGINGQYVHMILNYKYFPKRAEYQIKLLDKFQSVRSAEQNKSKEVENGSTD